MLGIFHRTRSAVSSAPPSPQGAKRSADTEQLLPASAPAVKLHKDSSGDVVTSATVTAGVSTDAVDTAPAEDSIIQLPRAEWQALLARVTVLESAPAQLAATQSQLTAAHAQLAATEAAFDAKLRQHTQDSIAREGAIKDAHRHEMATLEATVEFLNQRVRSKNMVLHGVPDTAAISRPADLERFVKCRLDDAAPGRGPSGVSQSVTAVTHIGKPGGGNRAVLVEYASSQAKHKAYALSWELRRQGFHLADELTPKQLQAQQAMEPDCTALRSKGYRPWYRRGAVWYSNQGVPRQCRKGDALRVPVAAGAPSHPPPARTNIRSSSGRPFPPTRRADNGVTAPVVLNQYRSRSGSPASYAHITRSDPSAVPARPLPGPPANSGNVPLASTAAPVSGPSAAPTSAPSGSSPQ
ncbi:hypothetical protein ABBQ32_011421 [Trebouxia sp. C0010 RCD-2024]